MDRIFDTHVQGIKYKAIREMIRAYDEGRLANAYIDIPKRAIAGPKATLRCCIYKERAIFQERLRIIDDGIPDSAKSVVEVLDIACDECPADGILVTQACRGCLSHKCKEVCPKDAISIVDKHSVIDKDKCIECGKCVSACPYGAIIKQQRPCVAGCKVDAISIDPETKKAVVNGNKCVSCGACVRQCPFGAIQDKSLIMETLDLLKNSNGGRNYKVYAIVAPSIVSQFKYAKVEQIVSGIIKLGFADVVEAAFGADVCLRHEAEEWKQKGMLTTSCCPAFVTYLEKNFPQLRQYVSSSLSPMAETARALKKGDPSAKCVFVGPCAAKKMETRSEKLQGIVDSAISFEELQAFFDAREIDISSLEETRLDDASYYGRIFARSGGITAGITDVAAANGIDGLKPVAMNGLAECKINLLKLKANKSLNNFFEGMACDGGCINGPLCLHQGFGNAASVDAYGKQASRTTVDESVRQYNAGKLDKHNV
ncbi:MAG: monomeric [FeFe] hydrogenase [Corallococcus sp.]|nr:monomeric [FeFe] hydrogenase [Corallococcus sp.]